LTPLLVLLPGMDGTGEHFAAMLHALSDRLPYTVVRYPDAPLEYSEYERIAREALPRNRRFVLLGESFSGPIALSIAATKPPGLAGYILCASFASCPRPLLRMLRPLLSLLPVHRTPGALSAHFLLGRFATPELRRANASALRRMSPRTLRARLKVVADVDVSAKLCEIGVPGLYLRGTEDRLVPHGVCHALLRHAPRLRVVDVEGPHFLLQVNPRAAAQAIGDFVESVENAA
jgi:pimeloyl-ACP methyl ester carboxylesterase